MLTLIHSNFQDYHERVHANYKWCQNINMIDNILNRPVQSADVLWEPPSGSQIQIGCSWSLTSLCMSSFYGIVITMLTSFSQAYNFETMGVYEYYIILCSNSIIYISEMAKESNQLDNIVTFLKNTVLCSCNIYWNVRFV